MSLINQMLQDLEARRVGDAELGQLPGQVRLPRKESSVPWVRIGAGFLAAGLIAGGVVFWHYQQTEKPVQPPVSTRSVIGAPQAPEVKAPAPPPALPPAPATPAPATEAAATALALAAAPAAAEQALPPPAQPLAVAKPEAPSIASAPPVEDKLASAPVKAAETPAAPAAARPEQQKSVSAIRRGDSDLKVSTSLTLPKEYLERSTAPAASARSATAMPKPAAAPSLRKGEGAPSIDKQVRPGSSGERAESEYRKAVALFNQGRVSEAYEGLRNALQADAGHMGARLLLTGMLMEQKRFDEAQMLLKEGLALNSAHPQLAMRLARIQVERGELGGAVETLQQAASAAADSAEYRGFHAAVLQRLGRHAEAAREFQAALRLAPHSGIWWMGLGISLEEDHRAPEAREAYQRARASGALSPELDQFVARKLRQLQ